MKHLASLMISIAVLSIPCASWATRNCAPLKEMERLLWNNFGERPTQGGISVHGGRWAVLASPDGATWTLLAITPQGLSCIVASGTDWFGARA